MITVMLSALLVGITLSLAGIDAWSRFRLGSSLERAATGLTSIYTARTDEERQQLLIETGLRLIRCGLAVLVLLVLLCGIAYLPVGLSLFGQDQLDLYVASLSIASSCCVLWTMSRRNFSA